MSDDQTAKIPTSHDLARKLLALPDLPLITNDDWCRVRLVQAIAKESVEWFTEGQFVTAPAIELKPNDGEGYGEP